MNGPPQRYQDNEDNDDDASTNGAAAAAAAAEPTSAELQRMVQQLQQELRAQRNETLRVQRELDEELLRRFHTGAATAATGPAAAPPERASESNQFTESSLRRTLLQIQSSAAPTTADNERFRRFQRWMVTKTLPPGVALQSDVSDTVINFLMPSLLVASADSSKGDVAQFVATETEKAGCGAAYVLRRMWLVQAIASAINLLMPSKEVDGMLAEEQKRRQEETVRERDVMCTMTAGITKNLPLSWRISNALKDWSGVTLDSSGNVTEITAQKTNMEGELNWSLLLELPQLSRVDFEGHELTGIFNTTEQLRSLPLVVLDLQRANSSGSRLAGVFDLSHLPAGLRVLSLHGNNFKIKNWSSIAAMTSLGVLDLTANDLASAGNIDFSLLPRTLNAISFQFCRFEQGAAADIACLPVGVSDLFLDRTTNLTVFCSDISMFAQFKLSGKSKERFHISAVALGRIGDSTAPVVSGKRLLEELAGFAHDDAVAACRCEMQRQEQTRGVLLKLVSGITKNLPQSWKVSNALKDWSGVTLDSSGNVTQIKAQKTNMEGELNWSLLLQLPQLRVLDLSGHKLTGIFWTTPQLRSLPLVELNLQRANSSGSPLTGVFDLSHLPAGLRVLSLHVNNFKIKNWSSIAKRSALETLWIPGNDLASAGNIDFSLLPRTLDEISLQLCRFEQGAAADIACLPVGIIELFLDRTTNLTVFCSDISMFARFKLNDKSKERFHISAVALGRIGDSTAPVVSGKQLLEFAASGAAHDAIVAAEMQCQAAPEAATTSAAFAEDFDLQAYTGSVMRAVTIWNVIFPGKAHDLGDSEGKIVSNALHRGKRPPCRGLPADVSNLLLSAFNPDPSCRPSSERVTHLAEHAVMLATDLGRQTQFEEWRANAAAGQHNQGALEPLPDVELDDGANDGEASSGEASTGVARQPHGNEGPASLQNRWLRVAGSQPSTGASDSTRQPGESQMGSDEVERREDLLNDAQEREVQAFVAAHGDGDAASEVSGVSQTYRSRQ